MATALKKQNKEAVEVKQAPERQETPAVSRSRRMVIPEYQVFRKEDIFEIRANLAGVSQENLEVLTEDRWLRIRGVANEPNPEGFRKVYSEFTDTDYEIGFRIPATVDESKIKATLVNGVLTVTMPKQKEHVRRTIEVKAV